LYFCPLFGGDFLFVVGGLTKSEYPDRQFLFKATRRTARIFSVMKESILETVVKHSESLYPAEFYGKEQSV
jgi:hypothetical protein